MKIFILGSTGMLGSNLAWQLNKIHPVTCVAREKINASRVYKLSDFCSPLPVEEGDYVINCIGVLKPQIKTSTQALKINGIFPHSLANYCSKVGAHLIHFSSDCVFDGARGSYTEVDIPDAEDIYGIAKSLEPSNKAMILRTSFIGEEIYHKRNLVSWLQSQKNKTIKGYTNCLWNGVTCVALSKIVEEIVFEDKYSVGLKHVFSPNTVSKFELCTAISNVYKLNIEVTPHKAEEISGTKIDGMLDRSLTSVFQEPLMPYETILNQIKEQKCTKLQKLASV
ncbi:hypothetical protein CL634_02040 [bacterium]|nr:hypothetical protein [bacterium]